LRFRARVSSSRDDVPESFSVVGSPRSDVSGSQYAVHVEGNSLSDVRYSPFGFMDVVDRSTDEDSGSMGVVPEDAKCVSRSRDVVDGLGKGDSERRSDPFANRDGVRETRHVVAKSRDDVPERRTAN
jgi:hypothetical protein